MLQRGSEQQNGKEFGYIFGVVVQEWKRIETPAHAPLGKAGHGSPDTTGTTSTHVVSIDVFPASADVDSIGGRKEFTK